MYKVYIVVRSDDGKIIHKTPVGAAETMQGAKALVATTSDLDECIIVEYLSRDAAISKHRKMWYWIADNPGRTKADYLREFDPEAELKHDCYLCEYTGESCSHCPLEWSETSCSFGLYGYWWSAMKRKDYTRAAEIAKEIAALPEKQEK